MTATLFGNISEQEKEKMYKCFGSSLRSYKKGEIIVRMSDKLSKIGIVEKGKANVLCIDSDGYVSVVEKIGEGDVFGELFTMSLEMLEYYVEAESDCVVRYIEYGCVIHPCGNVCDNHCLMINNLFNIAAYKSRKRGVHIGILSRKTTRQKLMAYFETQLFETGQKSFVLPISYTALAEYICADRSAMMRELKKMKDDGLIAVNGKRITVL